MSNLHPLFEQILAAHGMPQDRIKVGDRVRTGVYVAGKWRPMSIGIVVSQSNDGSVSNVDIMSLHGGAPWVTAERTDHLRREEKH